MSRLPDHASNIFEPNRMSKNLWTLPIVRCFGYVHKCSQHDIDRFNHTAGCPDFVVSLTGAPGTFFAPPGHIADRTPHARVAVRKRVSKDQDVIRYVAKLIRHHLPFQAASVIGKLSKLIDLLLGLHPVGARVRACNFLVSQAPDSLFEINFEYRPSDYQRPDAFEHRFRYSHAPHEDFSESCSKLLGGYG